MSVDQWLPASLYARITERRVRDPECAVKEANRRKRRKALTSDDGRLNLLAVDHPARLVTKVGDDPLRMANRRELLARTFRILASDHIDGIMATTDLLDDLFILQAIVAEDGGPRFLDGKVILGSMNRGGLHGSAWELDDPMTGATVETCMRYALDGAKALMRVALGEQGSLRTIEACAKAINDLNSKQLPMFLEPLVVARADGAWKVSKSPEELARLVGVASALGDSSRYLWLKLPYTERFELPAGATTLPILLLGGESTGDPMPALRELHAGMKAASNVRGALLGRNVLYPGAIDPLVVARAAHGLIHDQWSLERAEKSLTEPVPELA